MIEESSVKISIDCEEEIESISITSPGSGWVGSQREKTMAEKLKHKITTWDKTIVHDFIYLMLSLEIAENELLFNDGSYLKVRINGSSIKVGGKLEKPVEINFCRKETELDNHVKL